MDYRSSVKPKFRFPLPITDRQPHMMTQTVYRNPFTVHRSSHIMTSKVLTPGLCFWLLASGCWLLAVSLRDISHSRPEKNCAFT